MIEAEKATYPVEQPGVETAPHQVFGYRCIQVDHCGGRHEPARADPGQSLAAQRGRHRFAGHLLPVSAQVGQDAWGAIDTVRSRVELRDLGVQLGAVPLGRGRPAVAGFAPFVVPRTRHLQQFTHPLNGVGGLLRLDHPVGFYRLCSETKKAAAFFKTHGPNVIRRSHGANAPTLRARQHQARGQYRQPRSLGVGGAGVRKSRFAS